EEEEWLHRSLLERMMRVVGCAPNPVRELRAWIIGYSLSLLCRCCGWFLPMYAAGKLESRNIGEYEIAARLALICGFPEFVTCLLTMAEVEWTHEDFFRTQVSRHPLIRFIRLWPRPMPKENIRSSFIQQSR